jgi:hypothetical protein
VLLSSPFTNVLIGSRPASSSVKETQNDPNTTRSDPV